MKKTFHIVDVEGKAVAPVRLMMRPMAGECVKIGGRVGKVYLVTHIPASDEGARARIEVTVNFLTEYVPFDRATS